MIDSTRPSTTGKPPVSLLLAVWGESYIRQFFGLSLRSLLAPGNLPALAATYDCTFVLLTRAEDKKIFTAHPLYKILEDYCRIQFIEIDDLIFSGGYSATITLAYDRGMRDTGDKMIDTYFIYLVSDYVMADGSFRGLMRYMEKGYSGITAGNFQVVEEKMEPILHDSVNKLTGVLSLSPRELLTQSFRYVHPITTANTVNQPYSHTSHSNRFFWRVNEQTLIGRFYLRHMICIKPEITDYVIGASCDYSFIPEMCPSGNVAHIADSDEYCVIEMQPEYHEGHFLRYGECDDALRIKSLSEWTTAVHRANAHMPVIFHAGDISAETSSYLAQSETYVHTIERQLAPPVPLRAHPYWVSCVEYALSDLLQKERYLKYYHNHIFGGVLGSPVFNPPLGQLNSDYLVLRTHRAFRPSLGRHAYNFAASMLSGMAVRPRFFHPFWHDYRRIWKSVQKLVAPGQKALFVAYDSNWLVDLLHARYGKQINFQHAKLFCERSVDDLKAINEGCNTALILLTNSESELLGNVLSRCKQVLPEGSTICIYFIKRSTANVRTHLQDSLTVIAPHLSGLTPVSIRFSNMLMRRSLDYLSYRLARIVLKRRRNVAGQRAVAFGGLTILCIGYTILNFLAWLRIRMPFSGKSSAILTLKYTGKPLKIAAPAAKIMEMARVSELIS